LKQPDLNSPRAARRLITGEQFAALAELLRLRGGASQEAARMVLVEGLAPSDAARRAGTTPQATSNALASCRRGLKLARAAAGVSKS